MAFQTMNVVPTAECVIVHLSEIDTKLAAAAVSRNRKRTVCNKCFFWGIAVDHIALVSKACVWHPVTTKAAVYQSTQK